MVVPVALAVEATPITLAAAVTFERGEFTAELTWPETGPGQVEIHRDGELVDTVDNGGAYRDPLGRPANGTSFRYLVCHAGGDVCSAEVTVVTDRRVGDPRPPGRPVAIATTQLPTRLTRRRR